MFTRAHYKSDLVATPDLVAHNGKLFWRYPSGRMLPDVSGGEGEGGEMAFTQADVDRIVKNRLATLRAELADGKPADYDDLKAKAKKLDELEAANKTEVDRLKADLEKVTGERDTAIAERDTASTGLTTERRRNAVIAAAAKNGAVDPNAVWTLLPQTDKDALTVGDDGLVKETEAEKPVQAFLKDRQYLVGKTPGRPKPDEAQGGRGDAGNGGKDAGLAEARKRFGEPASQTQK
jgi:hypothetical protein